MAKPTLPGLCNVRDVLSIGRGQAEADAEIRDLRVRVVSAVDSADGFGTHLTSLGAN